MNSRQSPGFGKRGQVELPPAPPPRPSQGQGLLGSDNAALKWVGGGMAALALLVIVGAGTGGGSLLGGLIGGLLGAKLANKMAGASTVSAPAASPAAAAAPHASAPSSTVQRGGFGSTASSSGSGFSSGS